MPQLTLRFPSIVRRDDRTDLSASLGDGRALKISVFATTNVLDRLIPSIIPFLPVSLLVAGQERKSLHVDADIDDAWWLNLMGGFWPLQKRLFEFDEISVTRSGSGTIAQPLTAEVALMFSAGVDSFYSLKKMRELGVHPDWFVNINAGGADTDRDCWAQRLANVREAAREIGVGLITIDTNFHEIFTAPHVHSASSRNLPAAYSLFPGIARFAYSSTGTFADISYDLAKTHGYHYLDHAVVSALTPSGIALDFLGWDADRITKTIAIGQDGIAYRFLDVCVNAQYQATRAAGAPLNCGRCSKCIRTMITLDHYKLLQNFKYQFPLKEFFGARERLILALRDATDPLDVAVRTLVEGRQRD